MQDIKSALAGRDVSLAGADGGRTWIRAAVALVGFVLVAIAGSWPWVVSLNAEALRMLQAAFPPGSFDAVSIVLTLGASQVSLGLLTVGGVWLYLRGQRLVALSLGFVLVGVALEVVLKATLGHPLVWEEFSHGSAFYPFPELKTTLVTLSSPFPSGHVFRTSYLGMTLVAVLGEALAEGWRAALRVGVALFVAAAVFGVLYLGWHWPSDALGSLALSYALTAPTRWAVSQAKLGIGRHSEPLIGSRKRGG